MNTTLWIITIVLAVAFTVGGTAQILMPREKYRNLNASQHWVDDFSAGHLKAIGTVKLIGALGLVLPAALESTRILVPLAACGLMLFMAGAGTTRFRRSEWSYLVGDLVFLGLFAFVAWGRFDLAPL